MTEGARDRRLGQRPDGQGLPGRAAPGAVEDRPLSEEAMVCRGSLAADSHRVTLTVVSGFTTGH